MNRTLLRLEIQDIEYIESRLAKIDPEGVVALANGIASNRTIQHLALLGFTFGWLVFSAMHSSAVRSRLPLTSVATLPQPNSWGTRSWNRKKRISKRTEESVLRPPLL